MAKSDAGRALGRWGEQLAADYLTKQGYAVLERNRTFREGELDVIAVKGEILAITEVKLRTGTFDRGRDAVTPSKQRKIRLAAQRYLMLFPQLAEHYIRFDVCEIYAPQGTDTQHPQITYLENAFY